MTDKRRVDHIDLRVSRNLKKKRLLLNLSQEDVGKALGVTIQQIQKYESGRNRVSSGKLYALSKFLKVPLTYFYKEDSNSVDEKD